MLLGLFVEESRLQAAAYAGILQTLVKSRLFPSFGVTGGDGEWNFPVSLTQSDPERIALDEIPVLLSAA
jgi:hypothetical protein